MLAKVKVQSHRDTINTSDTEHGTWNMDIRNLLLGTSTWHTHQLHLPMRVGVPAPVSTSHFFPVELELAFILQKGPVEPHCSQYSVVQEVKGRGQHEQSKPAAPAAACTFTRPRTARRHTRRKVHCELCAFVSLCSLLLFFLRAAVVLFDQMVSVHLAFH